AERGLTRNIPPRGGVAANTVAGTISGWGAAHRLSRQALGGRLPLTRLLADAVSYAREGIPVTAGQSALTAAKLGELHAQPGFARSGLRIRWSALRGPALMIFTGANWPVRWRRILPASTAR